ncbi:reverse transcriptase domain-containing protein [Antrihabitans spumae]|uniref:Reverse transcriptase domain-containing protein n=1 Tax=Antrihabitans spumae TaxID=3373370 RepID=A0ABW7KC04_9NOCA
MPEISLADMVAAYRSAKVDLYYASESRLVDIVEYEEDLVSRLENLLERINGKDEAWVFDADFVGTYTFAPKTVTLQPSASSDAFFWSDSGSAWQAAAMAEQRPQAEFRVMSLCGIDMHVLSTLWMQTSGGKMEAALGHEAMGSRLRRTPSGRLNTHSPGSFQQYYSPYARWRDRGLKAMTETLNSGISVVALTADISSFYHKLNPEFLLNVAFLRDVLGVNLTRQERKINRLFVNALDAWMTFAANEGGWPARGLPVGLPASAVVANLALVELDRLAMEEFKPIYYGRYVDDVIIVLRAGSSFSSQREVWKWLIQRSRGLISEIVPNGINSSDVSIRFAPSYLDSSEVIFANNKNKTFHLSGASGLALVGSIQKTIDERASEWRSFTPVRADPADVGTDLAVATRSDGEDAATLRDADQVSTRRSAFAIRLRDFEAYERDLDLESWIDQRTAFFNAICANVLVLPKFFELASYLPRVLGLAAACGDFVALTKLLSSLARVYDDVLLDCELTVKAYAEDGAAEDDVAARWAAQLVRQSVESIASALTRVNARELAGAMDPLMSVAKAASVSLPGVREIHRLHARLFARDMAYVPYRFALLNREIAPQRGLPNSRVREARVPWDLPLDNEVRDGLNQLADSLRVAQVDTVVGLGTDLAGSEVAGLVFATRPPNVWELFLALRSPGGQEFGFASAQIVHRILAAVRGYSSRQELPHVTLSENGHPTISVVGAAHGGKVRFALAMVETSMSSLTGAALGTPDLNRSRYESFKRIFNEAVARPRRADYLVLPELALPSKWFVPFAIKLQRDGVSLIAGIEYLTAGRRTVHNEVWAALRSAGRHGVGYVVYPQDKQRPAPAEEQWLYNLGRLRLVPKVRWRHPVPPVIAHGDFRFAMLICSELTNIEYRAALRGRVDALVVPEWNKDLHTFQALVESAALAQIFLRADVPA